MDKKTLIGNTQELFKSKFNCEIDELTRVDVLEIIRAQLPQIRKKLSE